MSDDYDSMKAGARISDMWMKLGEQLAESAMGVGNPTQAVRYACHAEACFWKATGEADAHDVKDVLAAPLCDE